MEFALNDEKNFIKMQSAQAPTTAAGSGDQEWEMEVESEPEKRPVEPEPEKRPVEPEPEKGPLPQPTSSVSGTTKCLAEIQQIYLESLAGCRRCIDRRKR